MTTKFHGADAATTPTRIRPPKIVPIREAKARLSEVLLAARDQRVVITNHGKPVAIIKGLDPAVYDMEDVLDYLLNPAFWRDAAAWREDKSLGIPLDQVLQEQGLAPAGSRPAKAT